MKMEPGWSLLCFLFFPGGLPYRPPPPMFRCLSITGFSTPNFCGALLDGSQRPGPDGGEGISRQLLLNDSFHNRFSLSAAARDPRDVNRCEPLGRGNPNGSAHLACCTLDVNVLLFVFSSRKEGHFGFAFCSNSSRTVLHPSFWPWNALGMCVEWSFVWIAF